MKLLLLMMSSVVFDFMSAFQHESSLKYLVEEILTHKVAKELWERIQMLMQGTSLTKQERECKLYDEFDKFAYWKGETLRDFYLRFSLLLNDMNMYNMKLEQFQVNTKVSKQSTCIGFTTSAEQANLSISSAVISPTSISATCINISVFSICNIISLSPVCLTSSSNMSISYPLNDISSTVNHNGYMASSSAHQIDYAPIVHHPSEFSSPKTRLVVPVFQKGNDPIDAINHMISFLTAVVTSRQHIRMILESVEHGPLLWPSVTEDGVPTLKKYSELSSAEAIQADCDVKATNIILQALPLEIYALVSTHKVAKDLCEWQEP
nr:retrovirus-related Pol polyprotein from transposon TNT 1-94 [Tanacetum cinerariifolium]